MDDHHRRVLRELIERKRRPYLHYKPGPTQAAFMASPCLFKALHGPNRGGKTFHVDMEVAMLLEDRHPRIQNVRNRKFLFLVPGRQSSLVHQEYLTQKSKLRGPHGLYDEPMLDMREVKVIKDARSQPHCLRRLEHLRTGNSLDFIWAAAGARTVNLLEGSQYDGAIFDESAGTQNLLDEVYLRLLDAQADPTKPDLGFLWWSFTETKVNEAGNQFLKLCYDKAQSNYAAFRIHSRENPTIALEHR